MIKEQMNYLTLWALGLTLFGLASCSPAGGEDTGHEYMPDMKHSIAYESNYYNFYSNNTWGTEEEYHKMAQPRKPVAGTVPRGYTAVAISDDQSEVSSYDNSLNGYVPYYYEDTEEERTRATNEIQANPFPITEIGLIKGEELYNINCGICHGEKGDGAGYLVRDDGGKYPAQPANFLTDEFVNASPGRYYHSIMYGKNVMGYYKDKLSYRERWDVIHWIRALQAKDRKLTYSPEENTLNAYATPVAMVPQKVKEMPEAMEEEHHEDHGDHGEIPGHHGEEGHGDSH